jgi:hypothetical protein
MQDKELYQQILGLVSPWSVSEVRLDRPSALHRRSDLSTSVPPPKVSSPTRRAA